MNNSTFWGSKPISSSNGAPKTGASSNKKVAKKLGIVGSILLVILAAVGVGAYFTLIKPASELYASVNVVKADLNALGDAVKDRNLATLDTAISKTELDLKALRDQRDESFGWAKDMSMFQVNEFYSDSDRFINAGLYAMDALREVETLMVPFADAAGLKLSETEEVPAPESPSDTGLMEAFQSWISIMPDVAGKMDGVLAKLDKIGTELEPINVEKYPETINGVQVRSNIEFAKNVLSKTSDYGPDIKQALTIFPRVLAVGTPVKRYMIIMQNNKEIRPTGGFMTNYATFKIQDGLLQSDFTSKDMYSVDLTLDIIDATYTFPKAPLSYQKYLKNDRWYARDMNYSPDFPLSMDQFLKFYNLAGTISPNEIKPVDGIFAIDTQVIQELLDVTGPVTVNGVTYSADNVVLELETLASLELREQANRKKVLGDLMEAMLINVFQSDKNLWPKLIDKGVDLAMRKHVLVYVFDPEAQKLVEKYNLAGRIQEPVIGDYLMLNSANLGGDKTNWFVNKEVTHTTERSGDRWMNTVKIKYTYDQPGAEFGAFVKRFKDWVRLYVPQGSEFIAVDGSEDGTSSEQERGKTWYSAYLEMGPGESKEVTFKYYLPDTAITNGNYNLLIQKQPGVGKETYHINVAGKTQTLIVDKDTTVSIKL